MGHSNLEFVYICVEIYVSNETKEKNEKKNMPPCSNERLSSYGNTGLILGRHTANERRRYKVTPSLIGWPQT